MQWIDARRIGKRIIELDQRSESLLDKCNSRFEVGLVDLRVKPKGRKGSKCQINRFGCELMRNRPIHMIEGTELKLHWGHG